MNQVQNKLQQAYELSKNLDRVEEYAHEWEEQGSADLMFVDESVDGHKLRRAFYKPEPIDSINEIKMEGLLSDLENLDYILTSPDLPIMSKRMLSVLESVKDFPHQVIPVVIRDTRTILGVVDRPHGRSDRVNTDYVAVQLLEQLDIFDREKSIYEPSFINSNKVGFVDKLVLKVPEEGLPPIFRITDNRTYLYVSPEAKTALEEAGITGIRFVPIN